MTYFEALRRRITTPIPATAKGAQGTPLHSLARQPCATSAATGAICFTHVNGSRFVSAALRREGLAPPLQYNLNINSRRGAAPRLCLSKKYLWTFLTSCFQNCKINFCSIILQFCRCGGLFNAKGNPDGFLSHFSSLRNFRLGRVFDSLRRGAAPRLCYMIPAAAGRKGEPDLNDIAVQFRHVSMAFPGVLANDDVSLDIRKGEVFALVGENGAGKSPLMTIL